MINCPHCGAVLSSEPPGFEKLSPQQATIYKLLAEPPLRIWAQRALTDRLHRHRADGGPEMANTSLHVQIWRIRNRMGNVIETTNSGYRLRIHKHNDIYNEVLTESEENAE